MPELQPHRFWLIKDRFMRVFREHGSGEVLGEQEIYEATRQKIDGEYSLQDCQKDLKYLVTHYNLVRMDDMSGMAHSISAFDALIHKKFYQATSDGFAVEGLIEDRMRSNKGRLSKSDLRDVKKHLGEIDEYIKKSQLSPDDLDEIADHWKSTFDRWKDIIASAGDYFSALDRNAQYGQYNFEKYMEYKDTVVKYVQSFADMLLDLSHEMNELFSRWSQKKDWLIRSIAESEYRKHPGVEKPPL